MVINSLSSFLWTIAGLAAGVAGVAWLTTVRTVRTQRRDHTTATWQGWQDLLAVLRRDPGNTRARRQLIEALDHAADDPQILPLLAKTLTINKNEPELTEAISRSQVRRQIRFALESENPDLQIPALQLIAGLHATDDLPLVLLLAMSSDREVARAAVGTLEHLDPAAALDLLFQAIRTEGLWAFHLLQSVIRRGALDHWLAQRDHAALNDAVGLLGMLALTADEAIGLAIVDILTAMSNRVATQALGRLARRRGTVAEAAADALSSTPIGRVLLAKLELNPRPGPDSAPNEAPLPVRA